MKLLPFLFLFIPFHFFGADELSCGTIECENFKVNIYNNAELQNGLSTYMNYCYGCHSLKYSRYKRIAEDLEIPIELYISNLIYDDSKPGELMQISLNKEDAVNWLGAVPPDLTLEARVRKPEWIYTYLKSFYSDSSRPYGVNNLVYKNVSMPHVLEDLQNSMSENDFNKTMADLTNFLVYVSDPSARERQQLGVYVLLFLLLFTAFAFLLYREYKKELK
ncbi:cytochrome c1 [SAR86 cluster bacterium]|nr:cytochrome c1 [SAR86 cluster bacterium]